MRLFAIPTPRQNVVPRFQCCGDLYLVDNTEWKTRSADWLVGQCVATYPRRWFGELCHARWACSKVESGARLRAHLLLEPLESPIGVCVFPKRIDRQSEVIGEIWCQTFTTDRLITKAASWKWHSCPFGASRVRTFRSAMPFQRESGQFHHLVVLVCLVIVMKPLCVTIKFQDMLLKAFLGHLAISRAYAPRVSTTMICCNGKSDLSSRAPAPDCWRILAR